MSLRRFLDPVIIGDYPEVMKLNSGIRLEIFADEQKEKIINSSNFIGINFHKAYYVSAAAPPLVGDENPITDSWTEVHCEHLLPPPSLLSTKESVSFWVVKKNKKVNLVDMEESG